MFRRTLVALALGGLAVPAGAAAANYPPPGSPGPVKGHPRGKLTLRVCHTGPRGRYRFRSIQRAVDFAGRGDTIRVCDGLYRESVEVTGSRKAGLRLIGNPREPRRVVLDLRTLRGAEKQNAIIANGADGVTMSGFYARNYTANGFFAVNVDGYLMDHLVAGYGGKYGLYAFNAKGGEMRDSEAFYNNDSGLYVGQTPRQTKPVQTFVRRVRVWGNVIGFSGTNMRYTTITQSKWWNNGIGIVPNTLSTERFPPEEDNTITGNEIFWNNFNYLRGAPFKLKPQAQDVGSLTYPVGIGILLFGGRRNVISSNVMYGNYLAGAGMIEQVVLGASKNPALREASVLRGNEIRGNRYGLNGTDPNGHDVAYPGGGTDNCVEESGMSAPVGQDVFASCPFTGTNPRSPAAFAQVVAWAAGADPKKPESLEQYWRAPGHPRKPGYTPLERCRRTGTGCAGQPRERQR